MTNPSSNPVLFRELKRINIPQTISPQNRIAPGMTQGECRAIIRDEGAGRCTYECHYDPDLMAYCGWTWRR